jgi:cellulose synthase/poly-beta-1,6-N-acetylglucosamine synthase-like glycosyltransferase
MRAPVLTLVVAVYDKPRELQFIFEACRRQSFTDFELIVADDGSGPEIPDLVARTKSAAPFPIHHVWHEDRGWRKNRILNRAIHAASTEYIVFIDGDCIPHSRFIEDHWAEREQGAFLCGRRVEMSRRWSQALTLDAVRSGAFERLGLHEWIEGLRGETVRVEEGLRFENRLLRKILHSKGRGILGSNFSLDRTSLEEINGFDEGYAGPGCGEDSDIAYRLELNGLSAKMLRHKAIQFHMHHPRTAVSPESLHRFEEVRRTARARCAAGLTPREP